MRVDRSQAIAGGLTLALLLGFGALVWWPMSRSINADRSAIRSLETRLNMVQDQRESLVELSEQVRSLRAEVAGQRRTIASPDEMPAILREISLRIERAALQGEGITTGEMIEEQRVRALPVELTVGGTAPSVLALVESIETMPRLVQVDRLQINRSDEPGPADDATVHAQMRLTAYLASPEGGGR